MLKKINDEEIWKDVTGFEGRYQVSNLGNVRSLNYWRRGHIKVLSPAREKQNYLYVTLYSDDHQQHHKKIHRLVAEAFIPNPDGLPEVNHKDENNQNNKVENLEWCTSKYNINYGTSHQRTIEYALKYQAKPVLCINTNKSYRSIHEASRETLVDRQKLSLCCRGYIPTAGGARWCFISKEEYNAQKNKTN